MSLIVKFRQQAAEQREIANSLIEDADILGNAKKLIPAIVGHVNASLYEALADMSEYQSARGSGVLSQKRREVIERNNAIRLAVARNDWAEFDRLAGIVEPDDASTGDAGSA